MYSNELSFIKLILKKGKLRFRKLNLPSQTHIIVKREIINLHWTKIEMYTLLEFTQIN